jgi:four helix bundle protein
MAQSPEKLHVLKDAQKYANDCFALLPKIQEERHYRLKEQLQASSSSVVANLFEFCALAQRGSQIEKLQRCIAENLEAEGWIQYCFDNGLVTAQQYANLKVQSVSIRRQLYGLKKAVEKERDKVISSAFLPP